MSKTSQHYGKKIGKLEVTLDRKKTRYQWAKVEVELRFDIESGFFYAQWEGSWYSADTKGELAAKIKIAATTSLSMEWRRYIQIEYEADGWPIADEKSGRPATSGHHQIYELGEDRSKFEGRKNEKIAICSIALHWSICEISDPYALPEDPKKRVRARRSVDVSTWGPDMGAELIGEPEDQENDVLPPGTLLWTPEREALLVEIVGALGKLDRRLFDLFSGDTEKLAGQIDAAAQIDPSRLLAAPAAPESTPKKRRRA